ncbi:MAG TPA: ribokinase [Pirellulaceae bacterium]|nr:ribokinase [Pirellulaceae bacterium]
MSGAAAQPERPVRVVVVGSINMDLVVRLERLPAPGQTVFGRELSEIPGGKGANQAVAAARMGAVTSMVGRVGDDAYGVSLCAALSAAGVDVSQVTTTPGSSGLALIGVDDVGENSIVILPGANGAVGPEDVAAADRTIAAADVMLLQLEIPLAAVRAAIAAAKRHGVRVLLDPAPAIPDLHLDWTGIDRLCPNETELALLLGRDPSDLIASGELGSRDLLSAGAVGLAARGVGRVVVTLGAAGAMSVGADGTAIEVPAFPVDVVDSTAAGDAFRGALAVALAEGRSEAESLRLAAAAGALAASSLGAQPSLPTRAAVDRLAASRLPDRSID